MSPRTTSLLGLALVIAVAGGCGSSGSDTAPTTLAATATTTPTSVTTTAPTAASNVPAEPTEPAGGNEFPDILEVVATSEGPGVWSFAVTVSSPYDTPERYADGWRVVGPDGTVYGVHTLTHDHASEQPFTRFQSGVAIPDDVDEVTIEGRDQANGFGGATVTISLHTG